MDVYFISSITMIDCCMTNADRRVTIIVTTFSRLSEIRQRGLYPALRLAYGSTKAVILARSSWIGLSAIENAAAAFVATQSCDVLLPADNALDADKGSKQRS